MLYTIASCIDCGNLNSNDNRNVNGSSFPHIMPSFYLHSAGYNAQIQGQERAVFRPESYIKIKRAKIQTIFAKGLRESFNSIFEDQCFASSAHIYFGCGNVGGYAELFLQTYNQFETVDILVPPFGLSDNVEVKLAGLIWNYDAFKIKDDYKNQPFRLKVVAEIEVSSEVVRT
jgi:hypothetical protein